MWIAIFLLMLIFCVGGTAYLTAGFHRFEIFKKIANRNKTAAWLLSFAAVCITGGFWLLVNVWTLFIVLIHLFVFWVAADIISAVVGKIRKKKSEHNISGAAALIFTAVYLAYGWYMAHNIVPVYYTFENTKNSGTDMRIAMIADSHLGITLDKDNFPQQMKRIEAENPDVLIIAGDFVDDDSCREDMTAACASLGELNLKYGVYFTFGNHDKGYLEGSRDFTEQDLREELLKNNVKILEDETAVLNDDFCLIGRQDKQMEHKGGRASIADLAGRTDSRKYIIDINHQPNDYDAEAVSGCDLVLSGHTHGGPMFPAGYIGVLIGANDRFYGTENRQVEGNNTNFVVTSGISGWAIPFKTASQSEYVIIDIK